MSNLKLPEMNFDSLSRLLGDGDSGAIFSPYLGEGFVNS